MPGHVWPYIVYDTLIGENSSIKMRIYWGFLIIIFQMQSNAQVNFKENIPFYYTVIKYKLQMFFNIGKCVLTTNENIQ